MDFPLHRLSLFSLAAITLISAACVSENVVVVHSSDSSALLLTNQPDEISAPINSQQQRPPTTPSVSDITDLILVTGQSNALGAGTSYDYRIDTSDNRVFAYTSDGWQMADLHQVWDRNWFPRTQPGTDPSNNLSLHFGKRVVEMSPDRVVGFVLITAPGQPIAHWDVNGTFFSETRNKVIQAINELPSKSQLDGILWHQGESDGRDDDAYGNALYELISNFRSESWFGFGKPFICGETAALPVNRQLNKLNRDNDPSTSCIAAEGLPSRGDGAHFNAQSLRTIGQRYGDRYVQMTR